MIQLTHTLPSGIVLDANKDGRIVFTGLDEQQIVTSASELAYVLQIYQETFRGIPVIMDTKMWRGMIGVPNKG